MPSKGVPRELGHVRRSLEGLVDRDTATAAMLEALEQVPEERPSGIEPIKGFVRGPLSGALSRRMSADSALRVCKGIEDAVHDWLAEEAASQLQGLPRRSQFPTLEVKPEQGPTRLVVVAGSERLTWRLRVAVGGDRLAAISASDLNALLDQLETLNPAIVLIDAHDPPLSAPESVAAMARGLSRKVLIVLWGQSEPYAIPLMDAFERWRLRYTPLDRGNGVDPLLDLIRSRSSGSLR